MQSARTHLSQDTGDALCLGHEVDGSSNEVDEWARLKFYVLQDAKKVFRVEKANDVIDLVAIYGKARMAFTRDEFEDFRNRSGNFDGRYARARHHHVPYDQVF
jgi:hypothetical protein